MKKAAARSILVAVMLTFVGIQGGNLALADWRAEWEQTKQGGAKEGEVVLYGPHLPLTRSLIFSDRNGKATTDCRPGAAKDFPLLNRFERFTNQALEVSVRLTSI